MWDGEEVCKRGGCRSGFGMGGGCGLRRLLGRWVCRRGLLGMRRGGERVSGLLCMRGEGRICMMSYSWVVCLRSRLDGWVFL